MYNTIRYIERNTMATQLRTGRKRLVMDIHDKLHDYLKIEAAKRNITMTKIVLRALQVYLKLEKEEYMEDK